MDSRIIEAICPDYETVSFLQLAQFTPNRPWKPYMKISRFSYAQTM